MNPHSNLVTLEPEPAIQVLRQPLWPARAQLLWRNRQWLVRVTLISLLASAAIAFLIPKQYTSITTLMPPDQQSSASMMLAALASHAGGLGALGSLAGVLPGGHSTSDLLIDLLRSGTISEHLIDQFNLQHVYHKRYRVDTAKRLARLTKISEDKKTGVITLAVEDTSRERSRALAQAYLDELNLLVIRTNTSAAHRERLFIEERLQAVKKALEDAELAMSRFSSKNNAVDIKEQTRALVDAGARVEAELIVEESGLQSLRQIYGDGNMRVLQSEARIATLKGELAKMAGAAAPEFNADGTSQNGSRQSSSADQLYLPLRQLPPLAVTYTDLYRNVKVQETLFELLTQQYEMARISEAKDVPAVSVIDPPGIPEKKSFPPRLLIMALLTTITFAAASLWILMQDHWSTIAEDDPRKELADEVLPILRRRFRSILFLKRGAA